MVRVGGPVRPCHCCQEESALGRRFVVGGHEIVRCGRCGLQYVDPLPTQREIEALYGEAFFAVGRKFAGEEHGPGMVNAGARLRALRMLPDLRTQRWLDVGCATGDFLRCASGAVDSVHGVELSPGRRPSSGESRAASPGGQLSAGPARSVRIRRGLDVGLHRARARSGSQSPQSGRSSASRAATWL